MTVLESLARGWRLLLLVAVPLLAGVVLYTESLPDEYQATVVVSFSPRLETQVGADVVRLVVPKYEVYVQSESVVRAVARDLGVAKSAVADHLTAAIPQDTSNLEITVDGHKPTTLARAANLLARRTVAFSRGDDLLVGAAVDRAVPPGSPSGPPRRLIELAGLLAALLVAIGVVLFVDRLRPVVRTTADVAAATKFRLIGAIPRSSAVRFRMAALTNHHLGSAIRNLRTQLERAGRQPRESGRGTVLVVTSSLQAEGKTTVAALLALASARVDGRVLLVDSDLIHPAVGRFFAVAPAPGVAQALRGQHVDDDRPITRDNVVPGLSVMPTQADPDAGDLVARGMQTVLRWAVAHYSLVIVDAPPVLGNDTGQTLAALADEVILVVGRGTRVKAVEEAAEALRLLDAHVIGCVANGVRALESYGY